MTAVFVCVCVMMLTVDVLLALVIQGLLALIGAHPFVGVMVSGLMCTWVNRRIAEWSAL